MSVKNINEIGYRVASLTHGANYNAQKSEILNNDINAKNKYDKANNMRLSALTLAIHDNFENLSLIFREKDSANNIFSVEFSFIDIRFINDERIVLGGTLEVKSNSQKSNGTIEYNFSKNKFYRVLYYANGTIRRIHELELNPVWNNMKYVNNFLYFVSNFLYSEEDYETNININGPTISKQHETINNTYKK